MDWVTLIVGVLMGATALWAARAINMLLDMRAFNYMQLRGEVDEIKGAGLTHAEGLSSVNEDLSTLNDISQEYDRRLTRLEIRLGVGDGIDS